MITKLIEKLTGFKSAKTIAAEHAALNAKVLEAEQQKLRDDRRIVDDEVVRIAALSPKELATEQKEPWINVVKTHVDSNNIRNGFFELDWNEYFVLQLTAAGYSGETDETIVDKWFTDLCQRVGTEANIPDMDNRGSGYINVSHLGEGRSEVS